MKCESKLCHEPNKLFEGMLPQEMRSVFSDAVLLFCVLELLPVCCVLEAVISGRPGWRPLPLVLIQPTQT